MIDRRLLQHFDWPFLLLAVAIGGVGILALFSATNASADITDPRKLVYVKQAYWLGISSCAMFILVLFS